MLKKLLKLFLPPILIKIYSYLKNYQKRKYINNPNTLFDGNDSLFKKEIMSSKLYGEYGCGKSTKWVLNNTKCDVISVDTSIEWITDVKNDNPNNNKRLNIHYSDLGDIEGWGRPKNYLKHNKFSDYSNYLWTQKEKPDLVLVDGRFRVFCFLTSLKFANEGTKILFDDYLDRPYYHFVEKYISHIKECGSQSLFVVPSKLSIDMDTLDKDIERFRFVME
tara:strand:- start:108 stop:767 length:660 start_codon:yes stop_codon:yes gene_type:complete